MAINKKELNIYLRRVKKELKYSFNVKQQVMKSFKNQVYEFIETKENVSLDDVITEFGDYNTIKLHLKEEELSYYIKKARIMFILEIVTITIVILLIIYIIISINSLGDNSHIIIKKE